MGTKLKYWPVMVALACIAITQQQCQCDKFVGLDCARAKHGFDLPIRLLNAKDTIAVGDTIWFEVREKTTFFDSLRNQPVNYSGAANLGSAVGFISRDAAVDQSRDAVNKFNRILIQGVELRATHSNVEYRFVEENDEYRFKLGVAPKEKGLYCILFGSANNVYRKTDPCTKASFFIVFRNTNQHYYLLPNFVPGSSIMGGDYYFYVK